jgi:hypothetical protein
MRLGRLMCLRPVAFHQIGLISNRRGAASKLLSQIRRQSREA